MYMRNWALKRIAIHCDSWKNQLGELQSTVDYELTKGDFVI